MQKNIENKIRYKATAIYAISLLAIILVVSFLYSLKKDISGQKKEINSQYQILALTNNYISKVTTAQQYSGLYVTTKQNKYKKNLECVLDSIKTQSDSILIVNPKDSATLIEINKLLKEQLINSIELNSLLKQENPLDALNKKIKDLGPAIKEDTITKINISQDTLIQQAQKKGFFKRLKSVFRPNKDSVKIVITQRRDTIKELSKDSSIIVTVVTNAAEIASKDYSNQIKRIEQNIAKLIIANNNISKKINNLLLQLHKNSIENSFKVIEKEEKSIGINYFTILTGSIITLILILLFIWQIIRDINKAKQMREELQIANKNIQQILESRHKMLLSITHDIKSPLSSISGYIQLIKLDSNLSQKEHIKPIEYSVDHIQALLSNLLDFSALEQNKLSISAYSFNIGELANNLHKMFKPILGKKEIEFNYTSPDLLIEADELKIKQIATNLISNAIKYTTKGSIYISYDIIDTSNDTIKLLQFRIKDTGVGIALDKQKDLFKPFSRIKENNTLSSGNGFGLYVVKGLVELLNGTIDFWSEKGVGTEITCKFPINIIEEGVALKNNMQLRVSIFEDDYNLHNILTKMIYKLGNYVVDPNDSPNVVITDMDMGDITGIDILERFKDIPVILMTGRDDYTIEMAKNNGFSDFIKKPIELVQLLNVLNKVTHKPESLIAGLDDDELDEIKQLVIQSFKESKDKILEAIQLNDFNNAQAVCHKLVPLFKQFNLNPYYAIQMDKNKNKPFANWKEYARNIIDQITNYLQH